MVLMEKDIRVKKKKWSWSLSALLSLLMLNFNCPQQCNNLFKEDDARELVEKCKAQAEEHKTKETNTV